MLVKVNDSTFVRDIQSGALINQDYSSRDEYYAKVKMITNQKQELNTVRSEIDVIKNDISEIKQLMFALLNKGSNG
jgi:gluconate kinase